MGTIRQKDYEAFLEKQARISAATKFLLETRLDPDSRLGREIYAKLGLMAGGQFTAPSPLTGAQLLKRTEVSIEDLMEWIGEGLRVATSVTALARLGARGCPAKPRTGEGVEQGGYCPARKPAASKPISSTKAISSSRKNRWSE